MRDPERIDIITQALQRLWKKYPNWRFGQLIENIRLDNDIDIFYIEDYEWLEWIKKFT